MRLISLVAMAAGLAVVAPGSARAERVIISVGADALGTAFGVASSPGQPADDLEVIAVTDDVAVLSIDESKLEALTEAMHEQHGRCGGYMVHESLADGLAAPLAP